MPPTSKPLPAEPQTKVWVIVKSEGSIFYLNRFCPSLIPEAGSRTKLGHFRLFIKICPSSGGCVLQAKVMCDTPLETTQQCAHVCCNDTHLCWIKLANLCGKLGFCIQNCNFKPKCKLWVHETNIVRAAVNKTSSGNPHLLLSLLKRDDVFLKHVFHARFYGFSSPFPP